MRFLWFRCDEIIPATAIAVGVSAICLGGLFLQHELSFEPDTERHCMYVLIMRIINAFLCTHQKPKPVSRLGMCIMVVAFVYNSRSMRQSMFFSKDQEHLTITWIMLKTFIVSFEPFGLQKSFSFSCCFNVRYWRSSMYIVVYMIVRSLHWSKTATVIRCQRKSFIIFFFYSFFCAEVMNFVLHFSLVLNKYRDCWLVRDYYTYDCFLTILAVIKI